MNVYRKIIFSEVDGVLNSMNTKSLQSVASLNKTNAKALKMLVEQKSQLTIVWNCQQAITDDSLTVNPVDALSLLEWSKDFTSIKVENNAVSFQAFVEDFLRNNIVGSYVILGPDSSKFDNAHYISIDPMFGLMCDDVDRIASRLGSRMDGEVIEKIILDKRIDAVVINSKYVCTFDAGSRDALKFDEDPNCSAHKQMPIDVSILEADNNGPVHAKLILHRHDDLCKQCQKCASLFINGDVSTVVNVVTCDPIETCI